MYLKSLKLLALVNIYMIKLLLSRTLEFLDNNNNNDTILYNQ